jgi:HK97 family phage portal protein
MSGLLGKFFARQTVSQNPTMGQRIVYVESTLAGVRASPDTVLEISVVWACVNILAKSLAQLPWRFHKMIGSDSSEILAGTNIDNLLNVRPNPEMSAYTFRETMIFHLELWGNCYAEIERDRAGRPIALWPIEPDRVTPRRAVGVELATDGTEFVPNELYYWVRSPGVSGAGVVYMKSADIFHIHGPSWNGIEGYRTVAYAAQSLGLTMALERFGASFFGQGCQLGGVITNKNTNLNEDGRRVLLAEFNQRHQGPDKSHRWQYLDGDMDAKPFTVPPEQAQFTGTRQFQMEECCRFFGVPPHKVQSLLRATNNNIEHQGIEFVTDGILPRTIKFEQEANYKLLDPRGAGKFFTRLDVRSLQRGDLAARQSYYAAMWDRGVFTANDILHMEGQNPIPASEGGDKRFVPLNWQLLKTAGEIPSAPNAPSGAADPGSGGGDETSTDTPDDGGSDVGTGTGPEQGG